MALCLAPRLSAAYISEVDLTPRVSVQPDGQPVTLPRLIEISALTGTRQIELLVLDAQDRYSTYGRIRQVIRLNVDPMVSGSGGTGVMVLTEPAWPAQGLASVLPQSVAALAAGQTLDFGNLTTDGRALLLLSQWSIWTAGARFSATAPEMGGGQVLDYVTFGPAASFGTVTRARPYAEEPVLDPSLGSVIERPTKTTGGPADRLLDVIAFPGPSLSPLADYVPVVSGYYRLTPGFTNPTLTGAHIPETTSLALLAPSLMALALRRCRPGGSGVI